MKNKIQTSELDESELENSIKAGDISPVYIPSFATFSHIIKYHFCSEIIRYKKLNKLMQKDIAEIIEVNSLR